MGRAEGLAPAEFSQPSLEEQSLIYCNEFAGVKRSAPAPGLASIFRLVRFDGDPRINPRHKPFLAAATVITPSEICMNPLHTDCVICITYEKSPRNRVCTWLAWSRMKAAKLLLFQPSIGSQKAGSSSKAPKPPYRNHIVTQDIAKDAFFHDYDAVRSLKGSREVLSKIRCFENPAILCRAVL